MRQFLMLFTQEQMLELFKFNEIVYSGYQFGQRKHRVVNINIKEDIGKNTGQTGMRKVNDFWKKL